MLQLTRAVCAQQPGQTSAECCIWLAKGLCASSWTRQSVKRHVFCGLSRGEVQGCIGLLTFLAAGLEAEMRVAVFKVRTGQEDSMMMAMMEVVLHKR